MPPRTMRKPASSLGQSAIVRFSQKDDRLWRLEQRPTPGPLPLNWKGEKAELSLAKGSEEGADVLDERLRLLHMREVAAAVKARPAL
jgi:hypothetical protein